MKQLNNDGFKQQLTETLLVTNQTTNNLKINKSNNFSFGFLILWGSKNKYEISNSKLRQDEIMQQ